MTTDEQRLVNLAKLGDNAAFYELYCLNKERIYHLAYQYTRNLQDAEDLLQEIFTRAFLSISQFKADEQARFSTWLFRIGINCSINFVKSKKFHLSRTVSSDYIPVEAIPQTNAADSPEARLLLEEMSGQLERGMTALSAKQRMIFVLKHFQGLKTKEIAEHMKCSEGSIKKQLSRAFETLMKKLAVMPQEKHHDMPKNKGLYLSIFLQ